jgi:four helix bundle protein
VSTAANIVEGSKRHSRKDFAHFLNIAQGSNEEVKYYGILALDLGFIAAPVAQNIQVLTDELGAMLHAFAVKLNSVAL